MQITDREHNGWMPEDAFSGKKILIVDDDSNDTGATSQLIPKRLAPQGHPIMKSGWMFGATQLDLLH